MANRLTTVFQNLDSAINGNWDKSTSVQPHVNSYNVGKGSDIIFKTDDKVEYAKTKLELQQNNYLKDRWVKANIDLSVQAFNGLNNLKLMYRDADLMDQFPEIGAALNIYSEEATCISPDKGGHVVNVYSKSERIKSILEDLFINRLDLQTMAVMVIRGMCKYGNQFMLLNIDNKNGVMGWRQLPVYNVERLENGISNPYGSAGTYYAQQTKQNNDLSTQFIWMDDNNGQVPFRNWQIGHFRLINNSLFLPYGMSILNPARRHWLMLSRMEDMMLLYRLERSIERRVYKIFVGAIDDADVQAYVQEVANNFKRTPLIDPKTGQIDLRKNILPVHKDTPIPLLDGRTITIKELSDEIKEGKENYVYSIQDNTHQIVPGKITWCDKNYTTEKLYKITLDDDTYCIMAGEHEVIMRDGSKKRADLLNEGESVMPFYTKNESLDKRYVSEYQQIYNPNSGKYEFTHRLVASQIDSSNVTERSKVVHHCDFNRFNNSPSNLKWMGWNEHRDYHNRLIKENTEIRRNAASAAWKDEERRKIHLRNLTVMFNDSIWNQIENAIIEEKVWNRDTLLKFSKNNLIDVLLLVNSNERLHRNKFISKTILNHQISILGFKTITEYLDETAKRLGCKLPSVVYSEKKSEQGKLNNSAKYFKGIRETTKKIEKSNNPKHHNYGRKPINTLYLDDKVWNGIRLYLLNNRNASNGMVVSYLKNEFLDYIKELSPLCPNKDKITISRNFLKRKLMEKGFQSLDEYKESIFKNHKIVSIEVIDGDDVYCMTVVGLNGEDDRHNFALRTWYSDGSVCENGMFVSNCTNEDIFLPVRTPDAPTPIDTLSAAQNLTAMDDIKFVQNKVLTALQIPKTFLNFEETAGDGKNLALMDIRFTRTINRIQQAFLMELNKIASIHLYLLGFTDDLANFSLTMTNPSTQAEQLQIENMQKKIATLRDAVSDPGTGIPAMSMQRGLREILKWSDKDIQTNLEEIRLEKALAAELEKTSQIIKQTGIFDIVDRMYGEPGAKYQDDQQQQGGEGGEGMPGGGGGGMDFGGGDMGDLGNPGAEEEGAINGVEGEMDMGTAGGDMGAAPEGGAPTEEVPMESVLSRKPNLLETKKALLAETSYKRADIYDKTLMINEEFDKMLNSLNEYQTNKDNK